MMKTAYKGETIDVSFSLSSTTTTGALADPARVEVRVADLNDDTQTVTYSDLTGPDYEVRHEVTTAGDHIIVVEVEDSLGRVTIGVERLRVLPV